MPGSDCAATMLAPSPGMLQPQVAVEGDEELPEGCSLPLPQPIGLSDDVELQEKGQLAEYFGVDWRPERSTLLPPTQRSPNSRVRHAVGRLNDLARSPGPLNDSAHSPGPLEESMSQHSAFGRPSDGVEADPTEYAAPLTWEELFSVQTRATLELRGIEAKVGASIACAIGNMEGLTKRKAKILARQCGSMLAGRPARPRPTAARSTWSDTTARANALREIERGMRANWTERANQLSADREVPSAAANFVELEALRWENRKLADAKLAAETQATDQARRIAQLEETLMDLRLRPTPRRAGTDGEDDPMCALERQVSKLSEELQASALTPICRCSCASAYMMAARADAEAQRETAAEAAKERAGAAKRLADAVAERDLARQMLKGVQAMLGHAEAARSSAQKALQQAQAEKAASQAHPPIHPRATVIAVLAEGEAKRNRHAAELEAICASREQVEAQLAAAVAKLQQTQAALNKACTLSPLRSRAMKYHETGEGHQGQMMRPEGDTPASNSELASPSAAAQLAHAQAQEETQQLQAVLAERESALQKAQAKARALESECSALRAAVDEAEAGCRDLHSRLAEAEADKAANVAALEGRIRQLAAEAASKEQALEQAQREHAARIQAAQAVNENVAQKQADSERLEGDIQRELAAAQEKLRAIESAAAAEREAAAEAARARAEELARWAAAADRAAAEQAAKIADLEAAREAARRSALAELTACRDAGLQAVYELEAQVSELTTEKERLQAEVQRQRASLSKNRAQAEEELAVAEARIEKLRAEKKDALAELAKAEARAAAAEAELAEARAAHGRTAAEATEHLNARIGELTAARNAVSAEAESLRTQVAELTAERNYAVASKQQAAEAAAALEAEAATLLDQKKQAVTALQSQISQLKMERETMKQAHERVQASLDQLQAEVEAERASNRQAFTRLQASAEAEEAARRAAEGKLAAAEEAAAQLHSAAAAGERQLQEQKRVAEGKLTAVEEAAAQLRSAAAAGERQLQEQKRAAEGKLAAAEEAAAKLQEQKRAADARISALQTRLDGMQCAAGGVDTQKVKVEEFAAALREARAEAAELRRQLAEAVSAAAAERQPLALSPRRLPSAVKAAAQQHKSRSRCRVLARVRPMTRAEQAAGQGTPLKVADVDTLLLAGGHGGAQRYTFDRVFSSEEGQEAVYKEVAALVAGVMEGANGCVLAFGQSGSGKAHTLAGTPQHPGINFRAMSHLFQMAKEGGGARDTRIAMSIVEIHNDAIQDLLSNDPFRRLDIKIVEDGVCVPGLSIKQIASTADVEAVMCSASAQQHSSTSHLVLSVYVACKDRTTGATALGKLHMVNLAASELADREGDRSLSALGNCLQALQASRAQMPYEESCLTRLLADSMGTDRSRAVLIATCSPLASDAAETRRTLEFCARRAAARSGSPARQLDSAPTSPATGTVAGLAANFGGSTPRISPRGNQLFSPVRMGYSHARNAARKLDMNAVTPTVEPSSKSPQRFSARHAS
ncbi:probable Kinesin-like protein KIFC3 at C-terminar half [Coccomyxa sp. Obi]|nr:probable Kinesin-like protein KIFC3 at C-terminar half [Coccomyxa sp. Obi]